MSITAAVPHTENATVEFPERHLKTYDVGPATRPTEHPSGVTLPRPYGWAERVTEDEEGRMQYRDAATKVMVTDHDFNDTPLPAAVELIALDRIGEDGMVRHLPPEIRVSHESGPVSSNHEVRLTLEQARGLRDALDEVLAASLADYLHKAPLPHCGPWCGLLSSEHDYDHVGEQWTHELTLGWIEPKGNDLVPEATHIKVGVSAYDAPADREAHPDEEARTLAYLEAAGEYSANAELELADVERLRDLLARAAVLLKGGVADRTWSCDE